MSKIFNQVQMRRPGRNKFDLSHEKKMSLRQGKLHPVFFMDCLPGDSVRCSTEVFLRYAPLLAPIMHRHNVFVHFFAVPYRLVWEEWEDFITGGADGTEEPVFPYYTYTTANATAGADVDALGKLDIGSLADYFGLQVVPVGATVEAGNQINFSALPFRAYQLIFNEYYRDQTLQTAVVFNKTSGDANAEFAATSVIRMRCWEKDYFTSALPWPQRGDEVMMPIAASGSTAIGNFMDWTQDDGGSPANGATSIINVGLEKRLADSTAEGIHPIDFAVEVDNAETSILELRRAVRLQEWYEKNAVGGSRYREQIYAHFGVLSDDARLQRPQYLGGGKAPVMVSSVASTFQDDTGNPQATLAGEGTTVSNTNSFSYYCKEHCMIMGIMSVLPRTTYQQGIPKHFTKFDRFDFGWPEFAQIGEQTILLQELWYDHTDLFPQNTSVFGYQSRYSEYKQIPSTVHGEFRDSLDFWHSGRIFSSRPSLNSAFVRADPTARIFAVEDLVVEQMYCQLYNHVSAVRPLPYFGTPTL